MAPFVRRSTRNGHRLLTTVPAQRASEAAAWAQQLRREQAIEEFSLAPATLEDVYVELVGRGDALEITSPTIVREEISDVRAA
jgi:ABC-2 type transport system ATP-binding protein